MMLDKNSTLKVIKKTSQGFECACERCGATPDSDVVSMLYNKNINKDLSCRMCKLYDENGGLEKYTQFNNVVLNALNKGVTLLNYLQSNNTLAYNKEIVSGDFCIITSQFFDEDEGLYTYPLKVVESNMGYETSDFRVTGLLSKGSFNVPRINAWVGINFRESKTVVYCKHCKNYFAGDIKVDLRKGWECPLCYKARVKKNKAEHKKIEKKEGKIKLVNSKTEFQSLNPSVDKLRLKNQEKIDNLLAKNPDFIFGGITKPEGRSSWMYSFICKKCGFTHTVAYKTNKDKQVTTNMECPTCNSKGSNHLVGKYLTSHVGEVYNHLAIIDQNFEDMTCTVECIRCKKKMKNKPLFDILNRFYYCTCKPLKDRKGSTVKECCPLCYTDSCPNPDCNWGREEQEYTIEEVLKQKVFCKYNKDLNISQGYADMIISEDLGTTYRRKAALIDKLFGQGVKIKSTDTVRYEAEPIYVGVDDKSYYRCMCITCNKMLTLTDDEIRSFSHSTLCLDSRQNFVRDVDTKKIKF